jgi:hypothetical protein
VGISVDTASTGLPVDGFSGVSGFFVSSGMRLSFRPRYVGVGAFVSVFFLP